MKDIKRLIKKLIVTDSGKPRLMNWIFLMHTTEFYVRKWVAKSISINDIVLDVGARKFQYTKYQKCKMLFGVDLPSETDGYLGWTADSLKKISHNKNIFPVYGNCEYLPFRNNSFDVILIIEVIEHVRNDIQAVAELSRVLKPNGKLLLKTPNGLIMENTNPYHFRHYHPEQLKDMLINYFSGVKLQTKIPNLKLNVKQFLPKNKSFFRKAFYRYLYWIYFIFIGIWKKNKGSSIFVTCTNPKLNIEKTDSPENYLEIIACPNCHSELTRQKLLLKCINCKIEYSYLKDIPFLLNN